MAKKKGEWSKLDISIGDNSDVLGLGKDEHLPMTFAAEKRQQYGGYGGGGNRYGDRDSGRGGRFGGGGAGSEERGGRFGAERSDREKEEDRQRRQEMDDNTDWRGGGTRRQRRPRAELTSRAAPSGNSWGRDKDAPRRDRDGPRRDNERVFSRENFGTARRERPSRPPPGSAGGSSRFGPPSGGSRFGRPNAGVQDAASRTKFGSKFKASSGLASLLTSTSSASQPRKLTYTDSSAKSRSSSSLRGDSNTTPRPSGGRFSSLRREERRPEPETEKAQQNGAISKAKAAQSSTSHPAPKAAPVAVKKAANKSEATRKAAVASVKQKKKSVSPPAPAAKGKGKGKEEEKSKAQSAAQKAKQEKKPKGGQQPQKQQAQAQQKGGKKEETKQEEKKSKGKGQKGKKKPEQKEDKKEADPKKQYKKFAQSARKKKPVSDIALVRFGLEPSHALVSLSVEDVGATLSASVAKYKHMSLKGIARVVLDCQVQKYQAIMLETVSCLESDLESPLQALALAMRSGIIDDFERHPATFEDAMLEEFVEYGLQLLYPVRSEIVGRLRAAAGSATKLLACCEELHADQVFFVNALTLQQVLVPFLAARWFTGSGGEQETVFRVVNAFIANLMQGSHYEVEPGTYNSGAAYLMEMLASAASGKKANKNRMVPLLDELLGRRSLSFADVNGWRMEEFSLDNDAKRDTLFALTDWFPEKEEQELRRKEEEAEDEEGSDDEDEEDDADYGGNLLAGNPNKA